MRILVFGTGYQYRKRKEQLKNMTVLAFLDNAKEKQGSYLDGIVVEAPERVHQYSYDYIFLLSDYYPEMRTQLLELGVPKDKIVDKEYLGVFGLWQMVQSKKYEIKGVAAPGTKGRILLYSHELSLTGAPRVLYNMACILKQAGYYVEVCSCEEGKLLYEFLLQGIPVTVITSEASRYYLDVKETESRFDLVVVNTVCCYELIQRFANAKVPVVWWLHEVYGVYEDLKLAEKYFKPAENIYVYGMGYLAAATYKQYFKDNSVKELVYGIPEFNKRAEDKKEKNKLVFAVIGNVKPKKGQDILIEAVLSNWNLWKEKAEFWVIGHITEETKNRYEELGIVKVFGQLEHSDIEELYKSIDVVVCPSFQESMSIVVTEGLMQKKICIVSDAAGIAKYIDNYQSGLLCTVGDVDSLAEAIQWVIDHPNKHKEIGERAYRVYREKFSYEQFEKNVLELVERLV